MVSFATSLPELIITVLAIYKDRVDIAIANIIGSTIANSTIVIGFASLVKPIKLTLSNHIFDIYAVFISMLFLILITVTKSYNRYMAIVLFIILALFIKNLFWI
jgi:cation:H+ antiporter